MSAIAIHSSSCLVRDTHLKVFSSLGFLLASADHVIWFGSMKCILGKVFATVFCLKWKYSVWYGTTLFSRNLEHSWNCNCCSSFDCLHLDFLFCYSISSLPCLNPCWMPLLSLSLNILLSFSSCACMCMNTYTHFTNTDTPHKHTLHKYIYTTHRHMCSDM